MARVTVEDCIDKIDNRFELVMTAANRARKIGSGAELTIDRDNDKNPVVALREIADETLDLDTIHEDLVRANQRILENDDSEDQIDNNENDESWKNLAAEVAATEAENAEEAAMKKALESNNDSPSLADLAGESAEDHELDVED